MKRSLIAPLLVLGFLYGSCASAQEATEPQRPEAAEPQRTEAEVQALIKEKGTSPPEWWDSVDMIKYPQTLDLNWPLGPAAGGWNAQKNVGQYVWEVINQHTRNWRPGIQFMQFLLVQHQNDVEKRNRDMIELGQMYYRFEQDYARAAFWWQAAGVKQGSQTPLVTKLAICYWKLGNKQMAYNTLAKSPMYFDTVKILADMGYTDTATNLAERIAEQTIRKDLMYLYAGDACRLAGQYDDALAYYQKVLDLRSYDSRIQKMYQRQQLRARQNITAIKVYENLDLTRIPNGTYKGHAPAYAGELYIEVTIADGKITDVKVTQHKEKQFYSSIIDTPRQIVEKQGVKGVDAVTGATITSEAIVNAVAQALSDAQ